MRKTFRTENHKDRGQAAPLRLVPRGPNQAARPSAPLMAGVRFHVDLSRCARSSPCREAESPAETGRTEVWVKTSAQKSDLVPRTLQNVPTFNEQLST